MQSSLSFKLLLHNPMGGAVLGRRTQCRVVLVEGTRALESGMVRGPECVVLVPACAGVR